MAESKRQRHGAIQDTGNPVFDSTINLLMNWPCDMAIDLEMIATIHSKIAEIYAKEPKPEGVRRRPQTLSQMREKVDDVGAR